MRTPTLLLFLSVASAGCSGFQRIIVPSVDDTAPTALPQIFDQDGRVGIFTAGVKDVTSDPMAVFEAVALGWDTGGVRRVTMRRDLSVTCRSDTGFAVITSFAMTELEATVDAAPGDIAMDGMSVSDRVVPGAWADKCEAPFVLAEVSFSWRVEAEDHHGNVSTRQAGQIAYVPPAR